MIEVILNNKFINLVIVWLKKLSYQYIKVQKIIL